MVRFLPYGPRNRKPDTIQAIKRIGGPLQYRIATIEIDDHSVARAKVPVASRVLSGTPNAAYSGPDCTYRVTDSATPPATLARSVALNVDPLDRGDWRFRTRTVEPGGPCALRANGVSTPVAILPRARQGTGAEPGRDRYRLMGVAGESDTDPNRLLTFDPATRRLRYTHRSADPVLGTPITYRYLVGTEASVDATGADDALCVDVRFSPGNDICPAVTDATPPLEPRDFIHISLRIRDDAYLDGTEWRCPDTTAPPPLSAARGVSNPVHEALGPVHARRALDAAHGAVRDRVRRWTPGAPRALAAFTPAVGVGSLSGESGGFAYSGSSESATAGAELGSGAWQAGLIASFTRTDLRYRAAARLAGQGYRAGDHDTEILSLHPFAAWHMPSGGDVWASLGSGTGRLRHRDDPGFPSWSGSDVRLRSWAAGASLPVAEVLAGDVEAEAGVEGFALEIEGGGQISGSLPTLRGRDWRAGLSWRAPVRGAPSLSLAYRRLTGVVSRPAGSEGLGVGRRRAASPSEPDRERRRALSGSATVTAIPGGSPAASASLRASRGAVSVWTSTRVWSPRWTADRPMSG